MCQKIDTTAAAPRRNRGQASGAEDNRARGLQSAGDYSIVISPASHFSTSLRMITLRLTRPAFFLACPKSDGGSLKVNEIIFSSFRWSSFLSDIITPFGRESKIRLACLTRSWYNIIHKEIKKPRQAGPWLLSQHR